MAALVLIVYLFEQASIDTGLAQTARDLSPAQTEIAKLLARGRTLRQIADTTGLGYSNVRTHLKHIFAKLGV